MKPRPQTRRAFTLVEALLYVFLFAALLTVGYRVTGAGTHHLRETQMLSRDLNAAVRAGEQWRRDLRAAIAPPKLEADGAILSIETADGIIEYRHRDDAVWRVRHDEVEGQPLIGRVEQSAMQPDPRDGVTAWRWELELKRRSRKAKMRPLFTFLAVP